MRRAAADTATWARHANPIDRDAGQAFCRSGGRVVSASAADLRALRVAASPVTAALERNPATRALVARVRALAGTPPAGGGGRMRAAGGKLRRRTRGPQLSGRTGSTVRPNVSLVIPAMAV